MSLLGEDSLQVTDNHNRNCLKDSPITSTTTTIIIINRTMTTTQDLITIRIEDQGMNKNFLVRFLFVRGLSERERELNFVAFCCSVAQCIFA